MIANRRLISRSLKNSVDGEFAFDILKNRFAQESWHKRFQIMIEFDGLPEMKCARATSDAL